MSENLKNKFNRVATDPSQLQQFVDGLLGGEIPAKKAEQTASGVNIDEALAGIIGFDGEIVVSKSSYKPVLPANTIKSSTGAYRLVDANKYSYGTIFVQAKGTGKATFIWIGTDGFTGIYYFNNVDITTDVVLPDDFTSKFILASDVGPTFDGEIEFNPNTGVVVNPHKAGLFKVINSVTHVPNGICYTGGYHGSSTNLSFVLYSRPDGDSPLQCVYYVGIGDGDTVTLTSNSLLTGYKTGTPYWDTTPTENSNKPVTSGGIYAAIQAAGGGGSLYLHTIEVREKNNASWNGYIYAISSLDTHLTITQVLQLVNDKVDNYIHIGRTMIKYGIGAFFPLYPSNESPVYAQFCSFTSSGSGGGSIYLTYYYANENTLTYNSSTNTIARSLTPSISSREFILGTYTVTAL